MIQPSPSSFARALTCALSVALSSFVLPAQGPAPGLRLFGLMANNDAHLVDNTGAIVHTWTGNQPLATALYLLPNGDLLRTISAGPTPAPGGAGGVQRLAFDGTLLWDYRYNGPGVLSHHDLAVLPNGNVLLIAWEDKTVAEAVAAGRDPALIAGTTFRPDHIVEVQPTGPTSGAIVWRWHVWDHLVQDHDPSAANFGNVAAHPELVDINYPPTASSAGDWNHGNGLFFDPATDRILFSAHTQNEIWVIDHGTTTAEAAGHTGGRWGRGGDLLYRWGNPAAYRDTSPQTLFGQHAPMPIPPGLPGAGHVLVFNNQFSPTASAVHEFVLPTDAQGNFLTTPAGLPLPPTIAWTYSDPVLFSPITSNAERLPNGNTLICSGRQHKLLEVDATGQVVWQHVAPMGFLFHTHYVERSLWSSHEELGAVNAGAVDFELRLGSAHGGESYLLLASAAGTTPGIAFPGGPTLPLNADVWLSLSLAYAGTPGLLDGSIGTLTNDGSASATFRLVPGILPLGLQLDFAAITCTPSRLGTVSNPVPVTIRW